MQAVEVLRLHARPCRNGSPRACRQPPTHRPCGNGPSLPHAAASWGQPVTGPRSRTPYEATARPPAEVPTVATAGDSAGDSAPKPVPGRRRPTRSLADPLPETPPGNPHQRRAKNIHRRIQLSRHGLSRRCARPRRCRFRRCSGVAGSGVTCSGVACSGTTPELPQTFPARRCSRHRRSGSAPALSGIVPALPVQVSPVQVSAEAAGRFRSICLPSAAVRGPGRRQDLPGLWAYPYRKGCPNAAQAPGLP